MPDSHPPLAGLCNTERSLGVGLLSFTFTPFSRQQQLGTSSLPHIGASNFKDVNTPLL